ncbi:Hypothetical_protein [Hexamita inflata]|uniref:Hypothetical_protein n=1 Tax=Hexamita inflata TaxID=28002 RepID=A0AA86R1L8_9EUKA|nr:Hypothetical protein HINF_LOCUS57657 [Hexamita inflata]CAI9970019.1 Hypothetical protein HINF_LOCUS57664 [Hexamita inflata]
MYALCDICVTFKKQKIYVENSSDNFGFCQLQKQALSIYFCFHQEVRKRIKIIPNLKVSCQNANKVWFRFPRLFTQNQIGEIISASQSRENDFFGKQKSTKS